MDGSRRAACALVLDEGSGGGPQGADEGGEYASVSQYQARVILLGAGADDPDCPIIHITSTFIGSHTEGD